MEKFVQKNQSPKFLKILPYDPRLQAHVAARGITKSPANFLAYSLRRNEIRIHLDNPWGHD
jgi:hypothetical protein